jgi:hypothetical protein
VKLRRHEFLGPAAVLFALNLVLIGPLLFTERTKFNESIEGAFIGLARFFAQHPNPFGWYPYWYSGTPVQFTYTPGLHYINALFIRLLPMLAPGQVYHLVTGVMYALGTVTAAYMAYFFTRQRWWAFGAGLLVTLGSPGQWLVRELRHNWSDLGAPARLQALVRLGEGPHIASLLLIPLAACALWRAVEDRTFRRLFLAAVLLAATVLINWVGAFALGAVVFCFLLTISARPGWTRVLWAAVLAYLLAAFWITPRFVGTIAFNAQIVNGNYEYNLGMIGIAAGALAGLVAIQWWFQRLAQPYLCFLSLNAFFFGYVTLLAYWFGLYMVPQPERYVSEFEMFALLAACEGLRLGWRENPGLPRRAAIYGMVALGATVLVPARHFLQLRRTYRTLAPVRVEAWTEYQLGRWLADHARPEDRAYLAGSEGMSLNEWFDVAQMRGWFDPGVRDQQVLGWSHQISSGQNAPVREAGAIAVKILKALGARYAVVHGPYSQVAYRNFPDPWKFEGVLPAVYRPSPFEAIYEVPGVRLAHLVRPEELPARRPENGLDLEPLERYVAAVSDATRPVLQVHWRAPTELDIRGEFPAGDLISLRVAEAEGWRAYQGTARLPVERDHLGNIVLRPSADEAGHLRLRYVGSAEQRAGGWLSFLTLCGGMLFCLLRQSKVPSASGSQWAARRAGLKSWGAALPAAYLLAIVWVNIYICRELFFTTYTRYTNSMHGFWMALGRLGPADHWFRPAWWPFWYGGMPFEYTYAPLVPDLTAACARIAGWSVPRAFYAVSGFSYCFIPLAVFLLAWRITRSPGCGFVAGIAYSLLSPTELLVPDESYQLANLWSARRLFLVAAWDETPHLLSLALALLAAVFLSRSLLRRRRIDYLWTGAFMAATVLANAFGGVMILILVLSLVFALEKPRLRSNLLLALGIGAVAYAVISPWFPPSLVFAIRHNAQHYERGWTLGSWVALLAVVLGWWLLWRGLQRWTSDWSLRFAALFAYATSSIPLLDAYAQQHFLPQPGRYKMEMEIALVLLSVFLARALLKKAGRRVTIPLAVLLLFTAAAQVVSHRRFAKKTIGPADITKTIEYRVAKWTEARFPGQRVMLPGSIGQWLNAFSETENFAGGSHPTALNWPQQLGFYNVYISPQAEESIPWLKAFGVQAVATSGLRSAEFWKPYNYPDKFEGSLPVLWRQEGITIYQVPQRDRSLAHVVPRSALVQHDPPAGPEVAEARIYVAALERTDLPLAEWQWEGRNRARIRAQVEGDQVVSVQVNYHPGWHAIANGRAVPIFRDGLGLMYLQPNCNGPCAVELRYDGGWEYRLCWGLSAAALLGVAVWILRRRRDPFLP